jgi:hypothetical protein
MQRAGVCTIQERGGEGSKAGKHFVCVCVCVCVHACMHVCVMEKRPVCLRHQVLGERVAQDEVA